MTDQLDRSLVWGKDIISDTINYVLSAAEKCPDAATQIHLNIAANMLSDLRDREALQGEHDND